MISQYKDLLFWQRAFEVHKLVVGICRKLPNEAVSRVLINQIIRSAGSVGANIAEGFGRYKGKEYTRFLQISLGSANETDYWLLVIADTYPTFKKDTDIIIERNLETIKMLAKSLQTLNKNKIS